MNNVLATMCYVDDGENFLMLKRNKKENDIHEGLTISVGGKFEPGESPEDCVVREVKEETLVRWADQLEVPFESTIAIGDGANDLKMLKSAGLGIAFCAKDIVKKEINLQVDERDFGKVLEMIDFL